MKKLFIAMFTVTCLFCSFEIYSQKKTNTDRIKQLPPGHQLRMSFDKLPPQAKSNAEKKLNELELPDADFNSINLDNSGGVFYVDPVMPNPSQVEVSENPSLETGAVTSADIFTLHSKPGSTKVVFIDFNGSTISGTAWNNSSGVATLIARPYDSDGNDAVFSPAEIADMAAIWHRVAEDYAAFDIDVTTVAPPTFGPNVAHILITNRTDKNGNLIYHSAAGGVAYVNVWGASNFTYYQPALVFYNHLGSSNAHNLAEASSHEFGHNLGLSHDGDAVTGDGYYRGHGDGYIDWAPIMGVGYYKDVTQWSNGNYSTANNFQDDLAVIASKLTFIADDCGNTFAAATALSVEYNGDVVATNPENDPQNTVSYNKGVIGSSSDTDMFYFETLGGLATLTVTPAWRAYNYETNRGSNLDASVTLYNSSGTLLGTYSLPTDTKADVSVNLSSGKYYLAILGEGSVNFNNYASHGKYYISGNIQGGIGTTGSPIASFTKSISNRTVTFTDTSVDADGTIASRLWDFGNGITSIQQNPVHTYTADGTYNVKLTVTDNLGTTNQTSQNVTICLDTDSDGVCDNQDKCPGSNDSIDTDGDGTPDACDICNNATASFSQTTLSHTGSNSTSTSATINGGKDISFTISGLNSRLGGKTSGKFIEQVTVSYIDGQGLLKTYGVFNGNSVSSVNVSISGDVKSVTVNLKDGYDGNNSTKMSVTLSVINYCAVNAPAQVSASYSRISSKESSSVETETKEITIYPNPVSGILNVNLKNFEQINANMMVYSLTGQLLANEKLNVSKNQFDLSFLGNGVYLIVVNDNFGNSLLRKFIVKKK